MEWLQEQWGEVGSMNIVQWQPPAFTVKITGLLLTELGYAIRKHIKMSMFSVFRGYTLLTSMGMFGDKQGDS